MTETVKTSEDEIEYINTSSMPRDISPNTLKVVGITSVNCEAWVATDLAANLLGITTVPLYETLGASMLQIVLDQTEMNTIFGSDKCLLNILTLCESVNGAKPKELRYVKNMVVFDKPSENFYSLCL